ncbi:MAG TPA: helix-turn-helix domain-containing protein [Chloroflexota bacterium]|nr:helix-turn-helix domain-containing protein [Chloroflexota bacterium]
MERQTLTVEEVAEVLGISRSSAYLAVKRGELPVIRIGRRYVVSKLALERILTSCDNDYTVSAELR